MSVRDEITVIGADAGQDKIGRMARLKSLRMHAALPTLPFVFTQGQFEITITRARIVNGNIELVLSAKRNGTTLSVSNPFVFVNPPILVPDPAGDVVIPGGNDPSGTPLPDRPHREDLLTALKLIVFDTVRTVTR